jgi:hypothetical protein
MTSGCLKKIKSALEGRRFQDNEDIQKGKTDDGTESCSITRVPQMFPTVGNCIAAQGEYLKGDTS